MEYRACAQPGVVKEPKNRNLNPDDGAALHSLHLMSFLTSLSSGFHIYKRVIIRHALYIKRQAYESKEIVYFKALCEKQHITE